MSHAVRSRQTLLYRPVWYRAGISPNSYKYYTEFYEACQGFSRAKPHIFID